MNYREFTLARRLIAEETLGKRVRAAQRQQIADHEAEGSTHLSSLSVLRERGL